MAATGLMQEFGSRVDSEFHSTRALLFAISVLDRIDSQGFVTPLGQHMQVRRRFFFVAPVCRSSLAPIPALQVSLCALS